MERYQEIEGDLIKLALLGQFDVIAHGCNCFCRMKRGIAPQMVAAFGCDKFPLEITEYQEYEDSTDYSYDRMYTVKTTNEGDINKLGQIDYEKLYIWEKHPSTGLPRAMHHKTVGQEGVKDVIVVNCYTQYHWNSKEPQLNYEALVLCFKKMNHIFKGKHIGLPQLGCGLAGGDWKLVRILIQKYLKDCQVTVVIYKP